MGEEPSRGGRVLDIVSTPISRAQTLSILKCLILSLKTSNTTNRLFCNLLQLSTSSSAKITDECNLRGLPKVGPHTNTPLWVAKLSDTLLRRGDVNSADLINTDLNTYINAMTPRDQIVATMAKIDTHAQEGGSYLRK